MTEHFMAILWAVLFIVAIFLEVQTAEMVAVWFLPSTLISMILAVCGVSVLIQWVVFLTLSTVLLVLGFSFFRKLILKDHGKARTNADRLIGEDARVEEEIINSEMTGAVKIGGQIWSARMADDSETAVPGEFVTVEAISGVKLICKRKS